MHFWSLHFGLIPILALKLISLLMSSLTKKKKIDAILVPAVNLLTKTSYMANKSTGGTRNADVAIKIILKKYHVNILFKKINLSILAKLKNKKTKLKT